MSDNSDCSMNNSIPWIEKYRPSKIEDIIMEDNLGRQINFFLQDRKNFHLIITGVPGIGKTTTVKCIAKKKLGDNIKEGFLELNAAEDRGVKSIEAIVPPFCKKLISYSGPRIILFDEADNLTQKCQMDINDMMKLYGENTRFIFTCNESHKIITDIQSNCRILRFRILTEEQVTRYLRNICEKENISYDEQGLSTIYYVSGGDMRKSINDLQKASYSFKSVTKESVLLVCSVPDPDELSSIIKLCEENNLIGANNSIDEIIRRGYRIQDILSGIIYVLTRKEMDEDLKLDLINIVNETKIIVSLGLRSKIQLSSMVCSIIQKINYLDFSNSH